MILYSYYLLKVIICSAILFGYYRFMLRNKVFHGYNRFYLLATVLLSLSVPLIRINVTAPAEETKPAVIRLLQVVNEPGDYFEKAVIQPAPRQISVTPFLPFIYTLVSFILLIMLVHMLLRVYTLARKNRIHQLNEVRFVVTKNERGTPFSFFKYIFWNESIDPESVSGKRIFMHEMAHITQKHSLDKMFINIVLIFCWINPFFWLIRKELSMIHEFTADQQAVENGDTAAFAAMILESAYPQHKISITNNFFYSPLKRRLAMLTKNQHPKVNYFSRLMVLPIALIVFAAFAFKTKNAELKRLTTNPAAELMNVVTGISERNELSSKNITTTTPVKEAKPITVVVDAGHGGEDPGATAEDKTAEKDLTLILAKRIKELNSNKNIRIILTRDNDIFMNPRQKAEYAATLHPDLFISIHINSSPGKMQNTFSGTEVYISRDLISNNIKSRLFASALIGRFKNNYGLNVANQPIQRTVGTLIIEKNNFPSVIIEPGYINNQRDLSYLKSETGRNVIAENILNAINDYAATDKNNIQQYIADDPSDTIGYYKGKAVISVRVKTQNGKGNVTLTYADNTTEVITMAEAKKAGLLPPPPPPPPLPPLAPLAPVAPVAPTPLPTLSPVGAPPAPPTPPAPPAKSDAALNLDPVLRVGNLTAGYVTVKEFMDQDRVTVTDGYKFINASVYVSGKGYDKVLILNLNGSNYTDLKTALTAAGPGTNVTFDNVKVSDASGMRTIEGKSYALH